MSGAPATHVRRKPTPTDSSSLGFIDLHTHLDAQVGWDPLLRPPTWHGVTKALIGNCGVTFAPVRRHHLHGTIIVRDDEHTGARSGQVLRHRAN